MNTEEACGFIQQNRLNCNMAQKKMTFKKAAIGDNGVIRSLMVKYSSTTGTAGKMIQIPNVYLEALGYEINNKTGDKIFVKYWPEFNLITLSKPE